MTSAGVLFGSCFMICLMVSSPNPFDCVVKVVSLTPLNLGCMVTLTPYTNAKFAWNAAECSSSVSVKEISDSDDPVVGEINLLETENIKDPFCFSDDTSPGIVQNVFIVSTMMLETLCCLSSLEILNLPLLSYP